MSCRACGTFPAVSGIDCASARYANAHINPNFDVTLNGKRVSSICVEALGGRTDTGASGWAVLFDSERLPPTFCDCGMPDAGVRLRAHYGDVVVTPIPRDDIRYRVLRAAHG